MTMHHAQHSQLAQNMWQLDNNANNLANANAAMFALEGMVHNSAAGGLPPQPPHPHAHALAHALPHAAAITPGSKSKRRKTATPSGPASTPSSK